MIGFIRGKILEVEGSDLLIDVGGVGYSVRVADGSKFKSSSDKQIEIYTHTYVKEDELRLFGFMEKKNLKAFRLLIGVSGVGPKMAMNILGRGGAEQIQRAVASADVGFFTSVSGIGKKNSQRIIVDLKSKLGSLRDLDLSLDSAQDGDEVAGALVGMGYDKNRVGKVLRELPEGMNEEDRIKVALKELSK